MNAIQSVDRALGVLKCFGDNTPYLTAQQVASSVKIPRPSIYRFLKTLVEGGFLVEIGQDEDQRRYSIGPRILELSRVAFGQAELRRCAQPVMRLLAEKVGESVYLSVRHGMQATCIENVEGASPLRYGGRVGDSYPIYAGSPKAILAFMDRDLSEYLIQKIIFKRITQSTISSRDDLRRRLAAIRRRGFEVSTGEMFLGTRAIGAPIFDETDSPFAVLSVGAPKDRIPPKKHNKIGRLVVDSAREITRRYTRRPNTPTS
jgi:DNA-binding IclR family transcriptional regulator